ncbi:MAG: PAS domain S-box protein [Candidatus Marinimicrobia bacterium]|nr:PAS domain S-box protein [Candidatus Neomarinimicrobiota bacterium]
MSFLTGIEINFEDKLMPDMGYLGGAPIGRMSPATGIGFILTGLATLFLVRYPSAAKERTVTIKVVSTIGLISLLYAATFFFAYILGSPLLYSTHTIIPMALSTTLGFIFLSLAILTSDDQIHPIRLFFEQSTKSYLLRYFLPYTILVVILSVYLVHTYGRYSSVNAGIITSIIAVLSIAVTTLIVNYLSNLLGYHIDDNIQVIKDQQFKLAMAQKLGRVGTWELDLQTNVLSWTEMNYHIFGIEQGTPMTFEKFIKIIHPEDMDYVNNSWAAGLKHNDYDIEHRILVAGETRWVREKAEVIYDDKGKPVTAIGFTQDITEQNRAEQEIRNSEERYSGLFHNLEAGIVVHAPDTSILNSNARASELLGLSQDQLMGKTAIGPAWNFVDEYNIPLVHEDYPVNRIVRSKQPIKDQILGIPHSDKYRVVWVTISGFPMLDKVGEIAEIVISFIDITERKIIENSLNRSLEALNESQKIAKLGTWYLDLATNEVEWTEELYRMYGFDVSMPPPPFSEHKKLFTEESWERLSTAVSKAVEAGVPYDLELETVREDGSNGWMWVHGESISGPAGEIFALRGAAQDITDRKQVEAKVYEKDIQFRKLSANLPDLIFQFTRRPDGSYYVPIASDGIKNIFGCTPEDVQEDFAPISNVLYPEDAEMVLNEIEYSARHLTYFTCEFRVQIPGKPIQWIYSRSSPEKLADGSITWYGFNADITERKQAEEEHEALEAQLRQSQKLEAVGTMVGGIAHEFNNILQGLFLSSSLVKDKLPDDDGLHSDFQQIIDSSERAKHLVSQILTFSRKHKSDHHPAQIQYLVKESLTQFQMTLPSGIEVRQSIDANCPPVLCDTTKINQVFLNLCNNAVQAMEEKGGTLRVSLKEVDTPNEAVPGEKSSNEAGNIELVVSDTGQGMDAETLEQIFDPFFTTKSVGKGTGLGLSIVHEIINDMNGQIKVESEVGQGTTFTILLPTTRMEEETEVVPEIATDQVSRPLRILFVDDEEGISTATKSVLEKQGCTVTIADNGEEGLALFKANSSAFDMVITDLSMPEMSGAELGQAIRALSKHVPLLLSTGDLDAKLQQEYLSFGFNGFIRKPWSETELVKAINAMAPHDTSS